MVTERRNVTRPNTVERKIYFYRIVPINQDEQVNFDDLVEAMNKVDQLQWDVNGRYMEIADGNSICMWCDQKKPQIRLKIGTKRTSGLPDIENLGMLSPLNMPENAGLSELTHMIIFPDNVVGTEFNFFGPRVQRLQHYLSIKAGLHSIKLKMLLQGDIAQRLAKYRDISLLHLRFKKSEASFLKEAGGLGPILDAAAEQIQAPLIELVLRNKKYSKKSLGQPFLDFVKNLLKIPETKEEFDIFKIKGFNEATHRQEELDLLRDALINTEQVIKQGKKGRNIQSDSMYDAINKSYTQLHDIIGEADGLE